MGALAAYFELNLIQKAAIVDGSVVISTIVFEDPLLPRDGGGNLMATIDEEIKSLTEKPGVGAIEGANFAVGWCRLIESLGRIPALEYGKGGTWVLTAKLYGWETRDLIVGADGQVVATRKAPNCADLWGTRGIRRATTKAVIWGAPQESIEPVELVKDGTTAEENAVRADETLLVDPKYEHVGRRYRIPKRVKYEGNGASRATDTDVLRDGPMFWAKKDRNGGQPDDA